MHFDTLEARRLLSVAWPAADLFVDANRDGVITTTDQLDVARFRIAKLGTADAAYNYRVTLRVLKPASDPAWFANTAAADRVRVFLPTRQSGSNVGPQAGDVAGLG